jgi:hypothetical protein
MIRTLLAFAVVTSFSLATFADDKKPTAKTLEGNLVCTKCTLGETDSCGHALKVKESGKEALYYLADKGGKEGYHKAVCPADSEKKAKVTGKVVEKDGKKTIEEPKVTLVK